MDINVEVLVKEIAGYISPRLPPVNRVVGCQACRRLPERDYGICPGSIRTQGDFPKAIDCRARVVVVTHVGKPRR
jgi:hypothetical protein